MCEETKLVYFPNRANLKAVKKYRCIILTDPHATHKAVDHDGDTIIWIEWQA